MTNAGLRLVYMELIFGRARRDAAGESQNWLVEQAPHRGHKSGSGLLGRFVSDAAWTQPKNPALNARFNRTMNRTRRANQVTGPLYRFTSSCSPWAKSH